VLSVILFFPLGGTVFFIDEIIRVPAGLLGDVQIALLIGSLLFLLTFVMSGFAAGPFFANKIYITSTIQAVQMLIRVLRYCRFSRGLHRRSGTFSSPLLSQPLRRASCRSFSLRN
jgi:membrane-bound ClpP family serine protease